MEAMASGLPAVVADATGSRSIVEDGVNGFVQKTSDELGFDRRGDRVLGVPVTVVDEGASAPDGSVRAALRCGPLVFLR